MYFCRLEVGGVLQWRRRLFGGEEDLCAGLEVGHVVTAEGLTTWHRIIWCLGYQCVTPSEPTSFNIGTRYDRSEQGGVGKQRQGLVWGSTI